jgi:ParB family chromosome partitioning protein
MAGLSEVPVVIRQLDDNETLEIAIIENLQREDLNPIELALGYQALMDQYGLTQEQVAQKLGKSRSVIANTIRLLKLPSNVQKQVQSGKIPPGHAKALLSLEDDALIEEVAQKIVSGNVLVRDIEKLARERKTAAEKKEQPSPPPPSGKELSWGNNYMKEMELALSAELGRSVRISSKGKKYTLELDFYSEEELADIAARLTKSNW